MEDIRENLNKKFNKACEEVEVYTIRQILKEYQVTHRWKIMMDMDLKKTCEKGIC